MKNNMTESSESYLPKEIKLPFGLSLSVEKIKGGVWNPDKNNPNRRGTYIVNTENSADHFSQTFYNFRGNTKLGIGLVFPVTSFTPLKPDGTFDDKRYIEMETEKLLEESLGKRDIQLSLGILRKQDNTIVGLDLISIKFSK